MPITFLLVVTVPSPDNRAALAESMNRDLSMVIILNYVM